MDLKRRLLVIDDSPFIFKAVKRAVEPEGYEVVGNAENGKFGLELYEELKPDVITLDITMPIMDGLETAENLFKINPEIRIVMLSAMGDDVLLERAKKIGIKQFLSKPFRSEELLNSLNALFE